MMGDPLNASKTDLYGERVDQPAIRRDRHGIVKCGTIFEQRSESTDRPRRGDDMLAVSCPECAAKDAALVEQVAVNTRLVAMLAERDGALGHVDERRAELLASVSLDPPDRQSE